MKQTSPGREPGRDMDKSGQTIHRTYLQSNPIPGFLPIGESGIFSAHLKTPR